MLIIGETAFNFDFEDADHALFLLLGATVAEIQVFEASLSFKFSALLTQNNQSDKNFKENQELLSTKTLGWIANRFKKHFQNSELTILLEETVEKRNYVAHHILRDYGWPLMSNDAYIEAITKLEKIRFDIHNLEKEIGRHLIEENIIENLIMVLDGENGDLEIIGKKV
ncbi:MAG: hypothetical protein PHO27_02710 [Sulfuricurvum sp.]|nr:hypothetical protein [Sulfuricurvum sp.]